MIQFKKGFYLIFFITFVFITACTSNSNKSSSKKIITLGTNATFAPFEYRESTGEIKGFDIEIAQKIAEKLDAELVISDMPFGSLFVSLETNKIDFIAAGCTINEDRLKSADFSDTYFNAKQVVITKTDDDSLKNVDDLKNKKIGVQASTTGQITAENIEGSDTISYNTLSQAIIDLQNNKIDYIIVDEEPAKTVIKSNKSVKYEDFGFEQEEYAIAVKKGNSELLNTINQVLAELKQTGEYENMMKRYFYLGILAKLT